MRWGTGGFRGHTACRPPAACRPKGPLGARRTAGAQSGCKSACGVRGTETGRSLLGRGAGAAGAWCV